MVCFGLARDSRLLGCCRLVFFQADLSLYYGLEGAFPFLRLGVRWLFQLFVNLFMAFCVLFTFRYFAFHMTEPLCICLVELLALCTSLIISQLYVGKFVADLCKTRGDSKWRLTNVGTYFAKPVVTFTNILHDASQMRDYVYLVPFACASGSLNVHH